MHLSPLPSLSRVPSFLLALDSSPTLRGLTGRLTSKGKPCTTTSTSRGRLHCGDLASHPKDAAVWGEKSACMSSRTKEIGWARQEMANPFLPDRRSWAGWEKQGQGFLAASPDLRQTPQRLDLPARNTSSWRPGPQEAAHICKTVGLTGRCERSTKWCHLAAPWVIRKENRECWGERGWKAGEMAVVVCGVE